MSTPETAPFLLLYTSSLPAHCFGITLISAQEEWKRNRDFSYQGYREGKHEVTVCESTGHVHQCTWLKCSWMYCAVLQSTDYSHILIHQKTCHCTLITYLVFLSPDNEFLMSLLSWYLHSGRGIWVLVTTQWTNSQQTNSQKGKKIWGESFF